MTTTEFEQVLTDAKAQYTPKPGSLVNYRLTRLDVKTINRRYVEATDHRPEHRSNANGAQIHEGNQHKRGQVVPLLITSVTPGEYNTETLICRDWHWLLGEPERCSPLSHWGVNGQAFLDGNDVLWVTSAPQGDFNGGWNWS